jgi:3'(2'), 5'-bisphosphate nucleotidase
VKDIFEGGDLAVVDKNKNREDRETMDNKDAASAENPQTLADRMAQAHIVGGLKTRFSQNLQIVGEEDQDVSARGFYVGGLDDEVPKDLQGVTFPSQYSDMDFKNVQVFIDPLDGTKEYTSSDAKVAHDSSTILIGICLNGEPVAGVITRGFTGETLYGIVGVGWFCEHMTAEKKAAMIAVRESRDVARRIVCTTRSHSDPVLEEYVANVNATSVIRSGGCGAKVFLMLEGKADAYVFPKYGTKKWDTAAPQAILTAYGGLLTQPNGSPIGYSSLLDRSDGAAQSEEVHNRTGLIATFCGGRDEAGRAYHTSFCQN